LRRRVHVEESREGMGFVGRVEEGRGCGGVRLLEHGQKWCTHAKT
jgi:hypothetical protein